MRRFIAPQPFRPVKNQIDVLVENYYRDHPDATIDKWNLFFEDTRQKLGFPQEVLAEWKIIYAAFTNMNKINSLRINNDDLKDKIKKIYNEMYKDTFEKDMRFAQHEQPQYFDFETNSVVFPKLAELGKKHVPVKDCLMIQSFMPKQMTRSPTRRHCWAVAVVMGGAREAWKKSPHEDTYIEIARLFNTAVNIINQELVGPFLKEEKKYRHVTADEIESYKINNAIAAVERKKTPSSNYLVGILANQLLGFDQDIDELADEREWIMKIDEYLKDPNHSLQTMRNDPDYSIKQLYDRMTQYHARRKKNSILLHHNCFLSRKPDDLLIFVNMLTNQISDASSVAALEKIRETRKSLENWPRPLCFGDNKFTYKGHGRRIDMKRLDQFGFQCPIHHCKSSKRTFDDDVSYNQFLSNSDMFHAKMNFEQCNGFFNLKSTDNLQKLKDMLADLKKSHPREVDNLFSAIDKRLNPPIAEKRLNPICPICNHQNPNEEGRRNFETLLPPQKRHPTHIVCEACCSNFCTDCGKDHFTIQNAYICRGREDLEGMSFQTCPSCEIVIDKDINTCPFIQCTNCQKSWCYNCRCFRDGEGGEHAGRVKHHCMMKMIFTTGKKSNDPLWEERSNGNYAYNIYADVPAWVDDKIQILEKVMLVSDETMATARV